MKKTTLLLFFSSLFLCWSCQDNGEDNAQSDFDRQAMLTAYADNFILPAYGGLAQEAENLLEKTQTLQSTPSSQALSDAQNAWRSLALQWQKANLYNFGPASGQFGTLLEEIGTFPLSEEKTESYIAQENTSFQNFDRDTRGLYGVEYLLFAGDEPLTDLQADNKRMNYLVACAEDLHEKVQEVNNAWNSYREEFVSNDGTQIGSSTSLFYNKFVKSFEALKNFKLGLPLGLRAGQTQAEPQLVEAYYSGHSSVLIKAHFTNIQQVWEGSDNAGFKAYLQSTGNNELVSQTEIQMQLAAQSINAIPNSPAFSEQVTQNKATVETAFTELQKLTRFLKSEMSSVLGISITYNSGDGD